MLVGRLYNRNGRTGRRSLSSLINAWNGYPSLASKDDGSTSHPHLDRPQPSGAVLLKTYHADDGDGSNGGVLTLTLNRPHQRNALNYALLTDLHSTLTEISKDTHPNHPCVVVIQSEGPVFSSGHDLKELLKTSSCEKSEDNNRIETDYASARELFELCSETMQLLQSLPQPTICAVQGLATAAGLQIVCSCDIVLASPRSAFQTPGVNLGLFCHTPAVSLMRTVGRKVATDMLLTGRVLTSQEALQYGLVSRVVGNARKEAAKLANQIATKQSSAVVQMGKRILLQQEEICRSSFSGSSSSVSSSPYSSVKQAYDVATDAMAENMGMWDATHGIQSFLKKETPKWRNE